MRTESKFFFLSPQHLVLALSPNRTVPPLGVNGPRLGAIKRKG